jgi:hypothetical protein
VTDVFIADPKMAAERIRSAFKDADEGNYPNQGLVHVSRWDVEALLEQRDDIYEALWDIWKYESMPTRTRDQIWKIVEAIYD